MERTIVSGPPDSAQVGNEARASGVSWAAIIGGAFAAAALSLILLALGAGLGFSAVSPWSTEGASAAAVGIGAIVWLIFMQIASSGLGGYLAGRLRTKWVSVHTDEVFFRDTAHGFFVWAVATVLTAGFLTSAAMSMVGGVAKAGTAVLGTAAAGAGAAATKGAESGNLALDPTAYFVDSMFRSSQPDPDADAGAVRAETGRIFARGLQQGQIPAADKSYLAQLVASKTGLTQADAEKRVNEVISQAQKTAEEAKQAADTARKAAAHLSLWSVLALLIGAFCASYAATIGGRQRDDVHV